MSISIRNLSIAVYTNGWTLWHYRADQIADAMVSTFWNDAEPMLKNGDHISVSAPDGGATLYVGARGVIPMMTVAVE